MTESADIPAAPLDDICPACGGGTAECDCDEPHNQFCDCDECVKICSECLKFPCICEDGL